MTEPHPWLDAGHRAWLTAGFERLIAFAQPSPLAEGGFAYQDADGAPIPGRGRQLFLTARMAYVAGLGVARGVTGSERLLDHAVASLLGPHRDTVHGGWFSDLGAGPTQRKQTYDHVQLALGASSALAVGHPDAARLVDLVTGVILQRQWQEDEQALADSFDHDWSDPEPYRGANANMHGVEAMLALGDVTGDAAWHRRALAVADRIVNRGARALGWLVPEHFAADWTVLPEYNRDRPDDPFRPYGATPGHALEWARFLCLLDASPHLADRPAWLLEAAVELIRRALASWGVDGVDGLPYTVDWSGRALSRLRLHWPVCEAIQATAVAGAATGSGEFDGWYTQCWAFARDHLIDPATGAWINELDLDLREAGSVWPGRPDFYHSAGAYLTPTLPLTPFATLAARG